MSENGLFFARRRDSLDSVNRDSRGIAHRSKNPNVVLDYRAAATSKARLSARGCRVPTPSVAAVNAYLHRYPAVIGRLTALPIT